MIFLLSFLLYSIIYFFVYFESNCICDAHHLIISGLYLLFCLFLSFVCIQLFIIYFICQILYKNVQLLVMFLYILRFVGSRTGLASVRCEILCLHIFCICMNILNIYLSIYNANIDLDHFILQQLPCSTFYMALSQFKTEAKILRDYFLICPKYLT